MPKIDDVAKKAGVSLGTVSNVLNNPGKVKPSTRDRVLKVIEEIGFHPNLSARNLSRLKTDTIALIYPFTKRSRTEHYYSDFLAGVTETCFMANYKLMLSSYPHNVSEQEKLQSYAQLIDSRAVDGIIITRTEIDDSTIRLLSDRKQKFAVMGRSNLLLDFPWVDIDGASGIREAVRYLSKLGHKSIAYVGTPDIYMFSRHRLEGYRNGLEEIGLLYDEALVKQASVEDDELDRGAKSVVSFLKLQNPPRAVIVAGSQLTIGVVKGIEKFGYEIGKDISVICFDDANWSAHYNPPITSIRQPFFEAGKLVAKLMIESINDTVLENDHVLLSPELIIRESCCKV